MIVNNQNLFNEIKSSLLSDHKIGSLIGQPSTPIIFISGSRLLEGGGDNRSDIDIVCWTTTPYVSKQSYYGIEYKPYSIHMHGNYDTIQEITNMIFPYRMDRLQGYGAGIIDHGYQAPYILYLDKNGRFFGQLYLQQIPRLAICTIYTMFNHLFDLYQFDKNHIIFPREKTLTYLLLGSYKLFNEEPNGELILATKRKTRSQLTNQESHMIQEQIIKLYDYIIDHPFNIARVELEISDMLTQAAMEAQGINENQPNI